MIPGAHDRPVCGQSFAIEVEDWPARLYNTLDVTDGLGLRAAA